MPPVFLFDLSPIDLAKPIFDQEGVRNVNPQRGDMEQLNAVLYADKSKGEILGVRYIGHGEFWEAGHIPGRPLFPGVLMIEAAAQVASFYTRVYIGWKGFIGFGGVDECKFRSQIPPGKTLYILCKLNWSRHRRINCSVQGVVDGQLAYECKITGIEF